MAQQETDENEVYDVLVQHDPDAECPGDRDGGVTWKLYSFSSSHSNFKHPSELKLGLSVLPDGTPEAPKRLQRKLEAGLAFWVSYFEHGNSMWFRMNTPTPPGVEFQFDGRRLAGIMIWEASPDDLGPESYADRAADADRFLLEYNAWANGECWEFWLMNLNGEMVESGGAYYLWEDMLEDLAYALVGKTYQTPSDWDASQCAALATEIERMSRVQRENQTASA